MIVTLEHIWLQHTGSIIMREVATEEEAFAEMRRFLLINSIPSNVTGVKTVEEEEYAGRIIPKHKEVYMPQHGCVKLDGKGFPNPCFGIYDNAYKNVLSELKTSEEYGLSVKKNYRGEVVLDDNGYPMLVNNYYTEGNKWYTPLRIYLQSIHPKKDGDQ